MAASTKPRTSTTKVLLTGPPGIGKTTVIQRLAEPLSGQSLAGFYTEEIRKAGQRQGFQATTFSGTTITMAHVSFRSRHRVGRYGVDVSAFEELVMPELSRACDILLIDEIGKMECFSDLFVATVRRLLASPQSIVATIAVRGGGFIAEARASPNVEVWHVTHANRDELPRLLADFLIGGGDPCQFRINPL